MASYEASGRRTHLDMGSAVKQGAIGGLIAGIVFAMFEMIMAAVLNGIGAFFMPLRMIGAMTLGQQALDPSYSLLTAAVAGLAVHMMLSIIFGMIVGGVLSAVPVLNSSTGVLLAAVTLFGIALWIVNFYLIAPVAGWSWFPDKTNPVVQLIAHTFVYGSMLGVYLARMLPSRR